MAQSIVIALVVLTVLSLVQGLLGAVFLRAAVNLSASKTVSFKRSYVLNLLIWGVVFSAGTISFAVAGAYGLRDPFAAIMFLTLIVCFVAHVVVTQFGVRLPFLQSIGSTLLVGLLTLSVWGVVGALMGAFMRIT